MLVRCSNLRFFSVAVGRGFTITFALLLSLTSLSLAQKRQKLEGTYREWLERDVTYIITKGERDTFLRLTTDEARDKFIEQFWEIRNPTPGSPSNAFKDEHYQRFAYANDHFGHESGNQGWRTAMGRTYIVLGPPSQKSNYHDSQDLRPMEVWFYSNSHAALPPFFYIVFYREDNFSEYKLYSPYFDGPEKLVTQRGETRLQAWQKIDSAGGRELARVALSLIPGEPLDTQNATSSIESDVMLAILRDLPNHPLSLRELEMHRMNAKVSASLVFQGETLGVLALPVRRSSGDTRLDYLLRLEKPEDFSLAKTGDRCYFDVGVRVQVNGPDNKIIFTQEREYKKYLTADQVGQVKDRVFGYEGSLPLPPGTYHLELQLTDWLKKASYRTKADALIPSIPTKGMTVTDLIPFSIAKPIGNGDPDSVPFSFGGVQFTPLLKRETTFNGGGQIKVFYQIWTPPATVKPSEDDELKVTYVYGRPGVAQDSHAIEDKVSKAQFDANGSLLNGKEIPIGDWAPGNYKLVVTLSDPKSQEQAYSSLNFRLGSSEELFRPWGIDDRDDTLREAKSGTSDYQRGLCYLATAQNALASAAFRRALGKNTGSQEMLAALVDAEFSRQAYEEVAKYAARVSLTDQTQERTILHMAESLDKTGDTKKAIALLESALNAKPATGLMYLTLAQYYERSGDSVKAKEYALKGKQLMPATASP
jgi:GWxTD domain-containing protein